MFYLERKSVKVLTFPALLLYFELTGFLLCLNSFTDTYLFIIAP